MYKADLGPYNTLDHKVIATPLPSPRFLNSPDLKPNPLAETLNPQLSKPSTPIPQISKPYTHKHPQVLNTTKRHITLNPKP